MVTFLIPDVLSYVIPWAIDPKGISFNQNTPIEVASISVPFPNMVQPTICSPKYLLLVQSVH